MKHEKPRRICGHEVTFECDPESRRVTAIIRGCENDAFLYVHSITGIETYGPMMTMHSMYWASATCSPEDQFNEDTGRRIAYRRLLIKYLRYRNARIMHVIRGLEMARNDLACRYRCAEEHSSAIKPLEGVV